MKQNRYFLPMAALAFLMQGCAEDNQTDWQNRVPITLKTIMVEGDITRSENVNIQSTQFDKGETFYAYFPTNVLVGSNPEVKSTTFTLQEDGSTWTPVIQPYFADGANLTATVHAYYPSTVTEATTSFTVEKDQSQTSGYRNSDLMYATTTVTKSGTTSEGSLAFSHKMAKIIVHASAGQGVTTIQEVRIVGGYRGIDMATSGEPLTFSLGSTLSAPNLASDYITMFKNGNNGYADCAALIPPQTLDGDKEFLKIVTDAGTAVYKIGKEIESANSYMLNLTVSSSSISEATTISNWSNNSGSSSIGQLEIGDIPIQYCTGSAIVPEIIVKYNNSTLRENIDYKLQFFDNTYQGTAIVYAVGMGDYNGTFGTKTFTLVKGIGSISYELNNLTKSTIDDNFTHLLTKIGDGTVSYVSSDEDVATVDNSTGEVSVKGFGSTRITASVTDGTFYNYANKTIYYDLTIGYCSVSNPPATAIDKLICAAGHIHAYNTDAGCESERVALILYLGPTCNDTFNHGLAYALYDATYNNQSAFYWKTSNGNYDNDVRNLYNPPEGEDGLVYQTIRNNSTWPAFQAAASYNKPVPPNTSGWFLGSGYQNDLMGPIYRIKNSFSSVGGNNFSQTEYWSCSECNENNAWPANVEYGSWNSRYKCGTQYKVRSALAF